ncbi:DegT/DnrJ/EryC1/StrS family aminotransferase [Amycolatopsis sp. lyj-112]|uniref:DegT/DnrJ/EryC1/StrS family aminotransferase n=1 Tax=Amycolatopsis sp. lyj-112 TaxID=2789288 RepID=UPI00397A084A
MTLSSVLPDTEVAAYEAELADRLAVDHVVAVSSGTAALQCALDAVGVGPGDEVLMPALTVVMSAAPVHHLGATPVFVDCAADGAGLDYDDLAAKITSRTRAIMPVHLWGRADGETVIRAVAAEHGLAVIADACQALGTTVDTGEGAVQAGVQADIGCFSTHRLKLLSTDEGGFLTTNDPDLAVRARAYRSHWQTAAGGHRPMSRLAHNFRLAEPLAQIGRRELRRLDDLVAQRQELTSMMLDLLRDVPRVSAVPQLPGQRWNHYAPLLHLNIEHPRAFAEHLAATGVPNSTGTFRLIPMDQRPMFTRDRPDCVNAAAFLDGILALVLTRDDDMHRIRDYAETITQEVTRWGNT